jgi:hypothetical protein
VSPEAARRRGRVSRIEAPIMPLAAALDARRRRNP